MTEDSSKGNMPEPKKKGRHRKLKISLLILLAAVVPWLLMELWARWDSWRVDSEAQRVVRVIEQTGAQSYRYNIRGVNLGERINCWPDNVCPDINGSWFMPIENSKESEYAENIINKTGFHVTDRSRQPCVIAEEQDYCYAEGRKKGYEMRVYVYPINEHTLPSDVPSKDVSPKIWRIVQLSFLPSDYGDSH